jgi:poly(A) polymerase Pap1
MDVLSSSLCDKLLASAATARPVEELVRDIQPIDEERKAQRTQALQKLVLLLKMWARMVVYQAGQPDKVVTQKHLKLMPFGSYKYDDQSKDSDIDLLCVTSLYITRKHFFHDLCRLFEGMKEVEGFTVIMSAFVPIMKMKFHGVAMDICFTQLNSSTVPSKFDLDYIAKMNIGIFNMKCLFHSLYHHFLFSFPFAFFGSFFLVGGFEIFQSYFFLLYIFSPSFLLQL